MALTHAIMTALIEDEMSGIELAKSFDQVLGFFWRASHQQIYQELRKLSDKKWLKSREVEQQGKPNKIAYSLTAAGRRALSDWVFQTSKMQESKDELLIKLSNVSEENVGHVIAELEERRVQMMKRLYLYEAIRRRHYQNPELLPVRRKGIYLALMAGIGRDEQYLQWCDQALSLLASIEGQAETIGDSPA
jgi:DNA-binding PadR family transcriptional regulator